MMTGPREEKAARMKAAGIRSPCRITNSIRIAELATVNFYSMVQKVGQATGFRP